MVPIMDNRERPKLYTIGQVAKAVGLPAYTIRYWETEFRELRPRKSRSGRRIFTEADLALVMQIQDLLHNQGFTIKGAREALANADAASPEGPAIPPGYKSPREIMLEKKLLRLKQHLRELMILLGK